MATAVTFSSSSHRLVPTQYSAGGSVLAGLGLPSEVLSDLSELDAATNDRKIAELGGDFEIAPNELVAGVPDAQIINAAFTHPSPSGSRFNDSHRGAWYAGVNRETSIAEVAFHKQAFLRDAGFTGAHPFEYQDFSADFSGMFHQLDPTEQASCLKPDPVPACYAPGQALARTLLQEGSLGIVYPSVRHTGGTCIACFRPALVTHVVRGFIVELSISEAGLVDVADRFLSTP